MCHWKEEGEIGLVPLHSLTWSVGTSYSILLEASKATERREGLRRQKGDQGDSDFNNSIPIFF